MKVLVVYHTTYGHTLQLARAVEAGVKSVAGVEAVFHRAPEFPLSTRKTSRKVGSGATAQYRQDSERVRDCCFAAQGVWQANVPSASPLRSFLSSLIVPQGRESGCHSNVAVMQSTDNRNRNQATRSGHGFRFGRGARCITVLPLPSNP
jgi:hypothetical protein